jgi:hypothetical protein
MQPSVEKSVMPEGGYMPQTDEVVAVTEQFIGPYYGTVIGGGNLESGTYQRREAANEYARVDRAIYPLLDPSEVTDPLLKQIGREGVVAIISHQELGLMYNFESEYVPAITDMFKKTGVVEAMKAGRPVILGADHDNWVSTALLAIGASHALRTMGEPELSERVALSVGYAAASFDQIKIKAFKLDHMQAINMFVDIIKSFPNSQARNLLPPHLLEPVEGEEDSYVTAMNKEARVATDIILASGSMLVASLSGTHDKESGDTIVIQEPGPGTALMMFSDEVLARQPLYLPCVSLCNPFRTGEQNPDEGILEYVHKAIEIDPRLDVRGRMQAFLEDIQFLKARATKTNVVVSPHKHWDTVRRMPEVTHEAAMLAARNRLFRSTVRRMGGHRHDTR